MVLRSRSIFGLKRRGCRGSVSSNNLIVSYVVSHCLLWRHVTWRAQNFQRARHRALRFDKSRKTEVGEMRFALLVQQNVSRLDVAMQNPVLMRVVNGACHFGDEFSRLP